MRLPIHSAPESGLRSIDIYMPSPGAEAKLLPILPRPAVWAFAMTTVPSGAPPAARFFRYVLVESRDSKASSFISIDIIIFILSF